MSKKPFSVIDQINKTQKKKQPAYQQWLFLKVLDLFCVVYRTCFANNRYFDMTWII